MKLAPKITLTFYTLILLWLILFKSSVDFTSVLFDTYIRGINLIPFADFSRGEVIANFIVFVPLGLLLAMNAQHINSRRKLGFIFGTSLAVEITQFIFAIGISDVTDIIVNTAGGLAGLALYKLGSRWINSVWLDRFVIAIVAIAVLMFLALRFFVFKVRY